MDEPVLSLCKEFLLHSKNRLFESLDVLQLQVENLNQVSFTFNYSLKNNVHYDAIIIINFIDLLLIMFFLLHSTEQ